MNTLNIRFVRGTAWDSKLIEYTSRSWTSHVELLEDNGFTFGAQLKGGVTYRQTTDPCYHGVAKVETWQVPLTDDQDIEVGKFMARSEGLPYDWRAIVAFSFGERDWREPDSWFCSEWIMRALELAGLAELPALIPVSRITPRDVYMIVTQLRGVKRL